MAFQDFDYISERRKNERKQKLRKRIAIGVVLGVVIIVGIAGAFYTLVYNKADDHKHEQTSKGSKDGSKPKTTPTPQVNTSQKAIKTICSGVDYKETCETSLQKAVRTNPSASQPIDLLKVAISVAADELVKAMNETSKVITIDTPEKKAALDVCMEVLEDAREEFNNSINANAGGVGKDIGDLPSRTPDINNWLSAVLSYQQTCVDALPEGETKTSLEKAFKSVRELTSNSLAIVSQISSVLSTFKGNTSSSRRLLEATSLGEDGVPTWMDHEHRRFLKAEDNKLIPNTTVAKDGSGNFSTINEALAALPAEYKGRYVIFVKGGVYEENVIVTKKMVNITMYGEGSQKTIVTGSKNAVDGVPTFQTATFAAIGEGFMAKSIGFRNTAGPEKHQAVALRVQSDRSIFLNCRMEGYQDTLYAQTHRQFYRGCYIMGTVDFIFGDAAAVFQTCDIFIRKPMENQQNIVTAQGRIERHETTGIVLQKCSIHADEKLEPEKAKFKSYLGRPWKEFSRTIIMESEIGDVIHPDGWLPWDGDLYLKTLYYAEYNNKGPGADVKARVKWPGYKVDFKKEDAVKYTAGVFIQGESWLKTADIPVRLGLFN